MKNKIFFGIILIIIGLYQIFGKFMNLDALNYILNYQSILILIGIYLLFKNKGQSIAGIFLIAFGIYSYLKDFIEPKYLEVITPIIIVITGVLLIFLGLKKRN